MLFHGVSRFHSGFEHICTEILAASYSSNSQDYTVNLTKCALRMCQSCNAILLKKFSKLAAFLQFFEEICMDANRAFPADFGEFRKYWPQAVRIRVVGGRT